jgi:hypothetical protein
MSTQIKSTSSTCSFAGRYSLSVCASHRPAGAEIPFQTLSLGFTLGYSRQRPTGVTRGPLFLRLPPRAVEPPQRVQWYSKNSRENATSQSNPKSGHTSQAMSLNDLEFAYAPVRDQVRDLREYL